MSPKPLELMRFCLAYGATCAVARPREAQGCDVPCIPGSYVHDHICAAEYMHSRSRYVERVLASADQTSAL